MADGKSYERAKAFRKALTPPEARLWVHLKNRGLRGLRFRKQHPVGPYILDFYCAEASLAVEVDGASHDDAERIAHDRRRTVWLGQLGVRVIRVAARDVRDELEGVLAFIGRVGEERLGSVSPPPSRRLSRRRATSPSGDGEENS
ncbi:endonuclease domain-containing protein [Brevundimonas lenta]|uniref:Very-short-patch-repair endonuclease n=1 Tax=Brevundimonas lenta TaxID=424796 RepID=A0A7W6JBV6_9CAUL|nr:very-short-patch-repair endonuclease [Brevundimonas lenta]